MAASSPNQQFCTTADATHAGQRLDRFLTDAIGTLSRSRVKALIELGQARQGDVILREPADPVRAGVAYTLHLPPPTPATPQPQSIALTILHEDADLIVLDKPAGLVVHPAPATQTAPWSTPCSHIAAPTSPASAPSADPALSTAWTRTPPA